MKKLIMFLVICIVFTGTASAALRVHYEFDGNTLDQSGNGNDGWIADDLGYAAGMFGPAIDLDGTDDLDSDGTVDSVFISQDITGMTNATIVFWAAADAWADNVVYQNSVGYPVYGVLYGQWWNFNFNWGEAAPYFYGGTDTAYHHFAVTMADVGAATMEVEIFVDGSSMIIDYAEHPGTINFDNFWIGSNNGTNSGWVGQIDDFAIYDTVLSLTEIETIMADGVGPNAKSRCIDPPRMDISGDCKVDMIDFAQLALQWLHCGYETPGDCL